MNPSINARLQRGYQLARRLRRFVRDEQALRSPWGPSPRLGVDLLADGFHRDKLGLYPGIEDPVTRASYVSDLTTQRVHLFNGKSGELLTRKDVLLRVLDHHGHHTLPYHPLPTPSDVGTDTGQLRDHLSPGTVPVVALLTSRDLVPPQIIDLQTAGDPVPRPTDPAVLVGLDAGGNAPDPSRAVALRAAAATPTVLQFGVYWEASGPFVGHAVARRAGGSRGERWPVLGPDLEVERLDPTSGEAAQRLVVRADANGRLAATHDGSVHGLVPPAQAAGCLQRAVALARRFPNLAAIGFSYLLVGDELVLVDAANRLDVVYPQLFGPLLEDPRLRSAYLDAGMRPRRPTTPRRDRTRDDRWPAR